jgi:phytoene synthase
VSLASAYTECEAITRREAKNFSYGIKLLRRPERQAMSAVYALARRIDDFGDGEDPPDQKLHDLLAVREQLAELGEAGSSDPVLQAVADVAARYELPLGCFDELIDGCVHDVLGTHYETIDDLVAYCRSVAGSVGRLSLAVFSQEPTGEMEELADALGVALQLTNILRDVVEDRARGRVYLPSADAREVACAPDLLGPPNDVARLVALECRQAREWFNTGLGLLPLLDRRSRSCVAAMSGIYLRLLSRIEHDPVAVTRGRISVPTWEKAEVAARSLMGVRP